MPNEESAERAQARRRVIVKFKDNVSGLPYDNTIDSHLRARFPAMFMSLHERLAGLRVRPLFDSVPAQEIRRFQQRALDAGAKDVPNFLTYFAVRIPADFDPEELLEHLERTATEDVVEVCYLEETPGGDFGETPVAAAHPPQTLSGQYDPDVKYGLQRHLLGAPKSIDALYAWGIKGGDAAGMRFADIECGWVLGHVEFKEYKPKVLGDGVIEPFGLIHGTNMLGTVAGRKNGKLGQGIAYALDSILLASPCRRSGDYNVALALLDVLIQPKLPHVILFEVGAKNGTLPIEAVYCVRQLISVATGPGFEIAVIEPAGNAPPRGNAINIDSTIHGDSGAVIVGAVQPQPGHERLDSSNYGNRVDCYAWGDEIHTATTDGTSTTESGPGLGKTSGASAIIAGVALSIQGMLKSAGQQLLRPRELRTRLRNRDLGTPCLPKGSMPDLKKIAHHLGLPSASTSQAATSGKA